MKPSACSVHRWAACLAAIFIAQAQAQPAAQPAAPDPLDPQAVVPPVIPVSPLARYRPAAEVKVGSWREANDTVNRIGGWRTYAREAQGPATASPPPAASASAPPPPHKH